MTRLVHPALSGLSRDDRGFATGAPWDGSALRAPENLQDERQILRFGLGLLSALALLEAEGWPERPAPSAWAVAPDGLPVLLGKESRAPSEDPAESSALLLHRLLTGRRAPTKAGWAPVPRRHPNAAGWNAWFREVRGEGRPATCRAALRGLWSLADQAGFHPLVPSSWGVGARWSGRVLDAGFQRHGAHGPHQFQAALHLLSPVVRPVRLGDTPPYPYAALEPLASALLGPARARTWLCEHLEGGEAALAEALKRLLDEGEAGWVLYPAAALDRGSMRALEAAARGVAHPVVLLTDGDERTAPAAQAEALHLVWLPPVAEAWYLEHGRALGGDDRTAFMQLSDGLPPGQPRCGGSLVPPLPEGARRPARSFLGSRTGSGQGSDPEIAAREGRLADLLLVASELCRKGRAEEGAFWNGAVHMLAGQPALALSSWEALPASWSGAPRLNLYRSRAWERLQRFDRAREALKAARGGGLCAEDAPLADSAEAQYLWLEGRGHEAERLLLPLAERSADPDARAQALCHLATQALHDNRIDDAMRYLEHARGVLPSPPQPLSEFLLLHRTGMALRKAGDFAQALGYFEQARGVASAVGYRGLESWAECERGTVLGQLFRFDEAMAAYGVAAEGATALGLDQLAAAARFNLATCQVEAGQLAPAERTFAASLEEGRDSAPVESATDWYWLSSVRQRRGDYPGALEAAEAGLRALEGFKDPEVRLPLLIARGELLLLTGQFRKLAYVLRDLEGALTPEAEPNDRLAAAALKRAAAAKGEGTFTAAERKRAEALLVLATPYFRASWHLLDAQAGDEDPCEGLGRAWRQAREARSAHLACRTLWALAERGAMPALEPEDRRWLAAFLTENRVRGAEAGLLRFLGEPTYIPADAAVDLPEDLAFLARAESEPSSGFDGLLLRLGAACGCAVAPGRSPHWWGGGTAEQRRALVSAAGLKGEAPGPGGRILGHPGSDGLWFGVLRPGPPPYAAESAALFRVWARLAHLPAEAASAASAPSVHPAVARRILTRSPAMAELLGKVERAAPFAFPVLITGEAGSGKEVCARAIHDASPRAGKAWIAANCANLTPTLAASQLFGHRRGAFTGADRDQAGLVEAAHGGTLFLDEVGEIPGEVQPALLRFLQDGSYTPLGESRERRSEARVVAATNRDLERAVSDGRFREDLYHRLRVIPIEVPPLRRRPEDIPLLFDHFLAAAARDEGFPKPSVEPAVLTRLAAYAWPGNVRELQNLARSLLVEAHGEGVVREAHLPDRARRGGGGGGTLAGQLEAAERAAIARALKESGGSSAAAARFLGVSRQALAQKMKRLGIRREA